MEELDSVLKKNKYKKIKFKIIKTQHLVVKAFINGIQGTFIIDTGASSSCVGFEGVDKFLLTAKKSKTKASGAGATGLFTQLAKDNTLQLGRWKTTKLNLVVFDLSHVNLALTEHKAKPVDGIIGADILIGGKAIIDYSDNVLFLK